MPQIALTTFLKLWTHRPSRKESEYRKYLNPGGYDFYWSMKAGSAAITYQHRKLEDALAILAGLSRESEREHNASGITHLQSFWRD